MKIFPPEFLLAYMFIVPAAMFVLVNLYVCHSVVEVTVVFHVLSSTPSLSKTKVELSTSLLCSQENVYCVLADNVADHRTHQELNVELSWIDLMVSSNLNHLPSDSPEL